MTKRGIKSTPKFVKQSCSDFLSAYSSGKFFCIMLFRVTLIEHVLGLIKRTVRHNGHLLPRSIDWKRHERQKECPQGVVIGSNSNFRQSVQSNSSLRSGFPRLLLIILPNILSKFRRETRRGLLHITRTLSMNNKRYV